MYYGTLDNDEKRQQGGPSGASRPLLPESQQQQQQPQHRIAAATSRRALLQSKLNKKNNNNRRRESVRPVLKEIFEKNPRRKAAAATSRQQQQFDSTLQEQYHDISGVGVAASGGNIPTFSISDTDGAAVVTSPNNNKKSFIYTMLNPRSDAIQAVIFKWFITIVILADLIIFVISTEPNLSEETMKHFHSWEGITSTIFLIELLLRLITVTESQKYASKGPILGRLKWCTTWSAIIDIVATLPFFVELISGWDLPTLTYLRSFRLLRILKTSGFSAATNAVYRVIYYNRQILYVAMLICIALVIFTAVLMYYLRPKGDEEVDGFESLGATMYLATLMLTGQGGPDGDLPWYTKGVVLLTGVFSIGMFAIPASMLTWGFEAEAARVAKESYASPKRRADAPDADTWSFSSDDYSTDEEYRKLIAGVDDDEDDSDGPDAQAIADFRLADIDGSGNISLTEYLALSREKAVAAAAAATSARIGTNSAEIATASGEELSSRVFRMEQRIEENSKKLDKICGILESLQAQKK